jgi:hypothetical protein
MHLCGCWGLRRCPQGRPRWLKLLLRFLPSMRTKCIRQRNFNSNVRCANSHNGAPYPQTSDRRRQGRRAALSGGEKCPAAFLSSKSHTLASARPFQIARCRASGRVPTITLDADIHALIKQFWIVAGVKVGRALVCRAGHLRVRRTCGQRHDEQNSDAPKASYFHRVSLQWIRAVTLTG